MGRGVLSTLTWWFKQKNSMRLSVYHRHQNFLWAEPLFTHISILKPSMKNKSYFLRINECFWLMSHCYDEHICNRVVWDPGDSHLVLTTKVLLANPVQRWLEFFFPFLCSSCLLCPQVECFSQVRELNTEITDNSFSGSRKAQHFI